MSSEGKKKILFSEMKKKKDFFCFKNSVFFVLRKEKKKKKNLYKTKQTSALLVYKAKKKILIHVRGKVLNPRPSIQMGNTQPLGHMLCCDISCKEYMIRRKVF